MSGTAKNDAVSLMPTSWSAVPYMSDIKALNETDVPCLKEVRDVLKKHGMLDRFGVTLMHKHFELDDDEIMVETIDFDTRELKITPMSKSETVKCVETSWSLSEDDALLACGQSHCWSTCIEQEKTYREMLKS